MGNLRFPILYNPQEDLLTAMLSGSDIEALPNTAQPDSSTARKRQSNCSDTQALTSPHKKLQDRVTYPSTSLHRQLEQGHSRSARGSTSSSSGSHNTSKSTKTDSKLHESQSVSAFSPDDPLMPELLSWISCAAILGGLAGSVAVASCCQAIRQASGCAPLPSLQAGTTDDEDSWSDEHNEDIPQAGCVLDKVTDDLESFAQLRKGSAQPSEGSAQLSEGSAQPVKDAAEGSARRRRHSGKRNLHKPWTKVEEAELVCLVDQTDHRKQVLNFSRLTKGGWVKIAHHLGRSGPSAVQNITSKYRSLKKEASPELVPSQAANGCLAIAPPPEPVPGGADPAGNPNDTLQNAADAVAQSLTTRSSGKRHKLTACAMAIMGLQRLPAAEGTGKQILAAIQGDAALAPHLNWDDDQSGKVRWRNGVACALSADKSGIFKRSGKRAGQIVWQLDPFKAKTELRRYLPVQE